MDLDAEYESSVPSAVFGLVTVRDDLNFSPRCKRNKASSKLFTVTRISPAAIKKLGKK